MATQAILQNSSGSRRECPWGLEVTAVSTSLPILVSVSPSLFIIWFTTGPTHLQPTAKPLLCQQLLIVSVDAIANQASLNRRNISKTDQTNKYHLVFLRLLLYHLKSNEYRIKHHCKCKVKVNIIYLVNFTLYKLLPPPSL